MARRLCRINRSVKQPPQQSARIDRAAHGGDAGIADGAPSVLESVPNPSIVTSTVEPSGIEPTPSEVPQAMTSPGSSDMSCESRLTISAGGRIMSESA